MLLIDNMIAHPWQTGTWTLTQQPTNSLPRRLLSS